MSHFRSNWLRDKMQLVADFFIAETYWRSVYNACQHYKSGCLRQENHSSCFFFFIFINMTNKEFPLMATETGFVNRISFPYLSTKKRLAGNYQFQVGLSLSSTDLFIQGQPVKSLLLSSRFILSTTGALRVINSEFYAAFNNCIFSYHGNSRLRY